MDKNIPIAVIVTLLILILSLSGCLEQGEKPTIELVDFKQTETDKELTLPNWHDGEYHDYKATTKKLNDLEREYPSLVEVFSIGKSVLQKDIWCIKITNEKNNSEKLSCVIDGCIHGSEWETGELCLYLADYILINFGENKTLTEIVNSSEIYIIPLLNPDGRDQDIRWNENGIDLNRNFDVHFGRWKGGSFRLGKLFGIIKIPMIELPKKGVKTNAGRKPFSEPETAALRDFMKSLDSDKLSFYLNCHTAVHAFFSVLDIPYKPEFTTTEHEKDVLNSALSWAEENTEYDVFFVDTYDHHGAGFAHHWVFKEFRKPSFCYEILSQDYEPWYDSGNRHDSLVHWMKASVPIMLYLLTNMENLNNWEIPDNEPYLPEGVPPEEI